MSDYNKVVTNEDGITSEQLHKLFRNVVKGGEIYIYVEAPNGTPIATKVKVASTQFGHLYLDTKTIHDRRKEHMVKGKGCGKLLDKDQWWNFCGETDMGQTLPALCIKCGGGYKLKDDE